MHFSFIFGPAMTKLHYRDLIFRAVQRADSAQLDLLVAQLTDAERAREILRAKGYGATGMTGSATAAQVPDAATVSFIHRMLAPA